MLLIRATGFPFVRVPVLSNTTVSIRARRSIASGLTTSRPSRARRELTAANVAGVAKDSAHGQVTTSTAKVAVITYDGSITPQYTATELARIRVHTEKSDA